MLFELLVRATQLVSLHRHARERRPRRGERLLELRDAPAQLLGRVFLGFGWSRLDTRRP